MSATSSTTAAVATPTRLEALAQGIAGALPALKAVENHAGELTYEVPANDLLTVAQVLRDAAEFKFEMCMDVCGVDYLSHGRDEWNTETATSPRRAARSIASAARSTSARERAWR